MSSKETVLITGGTGLVGSALRQIYPSAICIGSKDYDLRIQSEVESMFAKHKPSHVFHLAAKVGGVLDNKTYLADYYNDNIMINTNVLRTAADNNVEKVVSLLSTCIYPDDTTYPLDENNIHAGPPHPSNYGYAYAKRMLDIHSRAIRSQKNLNFVCAVPNNIFGKNDNFDLRSSHVIPAIIRKVYEAKQKTRAVTLWGDGSPIREFTHSTDVAKALKIVMDTYNDPSPINIGNSYSISIKSLAEKICKNFDYDGGIIWNTDKPTGQMKKPSSNKKFLSLTNFQYGNFDNQLKSVCRWFESNYPKKIRGVQE